MHYTDASGNFEFQARFGAREIETPGLRGHQTTTPRRTGEAMCARVRAAGSAATGSDVVNAFAQDDAVRGFLDQALHAQILHDPAHHLTRCADHLGDVLLGSYNFV